MTLSVSMLLLLLLLGSTRRGRLLGREVGAGRRSRGLRNGWVVEGELGISGG